MCRSQAEGGQRCSAHTRPALNAAEEALRQARQTTRVAAERYENSPVGMNPDATAAYRDWKTAQRAEEQAVRAHESAMINHASTRSGLAEFVTRAETIEAKVDAALEAHPQGNAEVRRMIGEVSHLHTIIHRGMAQKAATEQVAARLSGHPAAPMPKAALRTMLTPDLHVVARNLRGSRGDEERVIHSVNDKQIRWSRVGGTANGSTALTGLKCFRDGPSIYLHDDNGPLVVFTVPND